MNQIVRNEIFTSVSIFCEMQILPTQYTIQSLKIWCKQNGKEQEIVPFVFQWEATLTFKKEICWSEYFTSFQFSISMLYWWLKDGKARLLVLSFAVSKACWVYLFSSALGCRKAKGPKLCHFLFTHSRGINSSFWYQPCSVPVCTLSLWALWKALPLFNRIRNAKGLWHTNGVPTFQERRRYKGAGTP